MSSSCGQLCGRVRWSQITARARGEVQASPWVPARLRGRGRWGAQCSLLLARRGPRAVTRRACPGDPACHVTSELEATAPPGADREASADLARQAGAAARQSSRRGSRPFVDGRVPDPLSDSAVPMAIIPIVARALQVTCQNSSNGHLTRAQGSSLVILRQLYLHSGFTAKQADGDQLCSSFAESL